VYMVMDIADDWHISSDGTPKRIDEFWNRIFQTKDDNGKHKLKLLPKIIKPLLCLSHGNADPEREFSINKRLITSDRSSLSEMSINGLRTVEDVICRCGG